MELHPQVTLVLFRLYLLIRDVVDTVFSTTNKAVTGAIRAFEPRIYYFLKGYTTPYSANSVNIYASTGAPVDFVYNADDKIFKDTSEFTVAKYLPVLSLEIIRDDAVIYDLTDFIESMTVVADVAAFRYPSVSQIVNAWAIGSQIVFDSNIDFKLRCVSDMGDTYEFSVKDTIDLLEGMNEADETIPEVEQLEQAVQVGQAVEQAVEQAVQVEQAVEQVEQAVEQVEQAVEQVEQAEKVEAPEEGEIQESALAEATPI